MHRTTRQLEMTHTVLAAATDHPTAEQILRRVRKHLPRVSLGTVYRNLDKLRALGRLRVVNVGPGVARYDALLSEHDHFLCERCDAVIDLPVVPERADVTDLRQDGYVVRARSVVVHGLCPPCANGASGAVRPARDRSTASPPPSERSRA